MPKRKPGRPRTTGSKSTAPIQFRIGAAEREQAQALADARELVSADVLAKGLLLAELATHKVPGGRYKSSKSGAS